MTTTSTTIRPRVRTPVLDAAVASMVDLARAAAEAVRGPSSVGPHSGVVAEGDRVVTHRFEASLPGYRGWQWAVTVARASRSRTATVSEVVLLPAADALVAPDWVPWSERIEPGDVGVGDLLPTHVDDPRLESGYSPTTTSAEVDDELGGGYTGVDEDLVGVVAYELGLGRVRVLSPYGRDEAATRWYEGSAGPDAPVAQAAPAKCATCGFLVGLGGPLRALFGACTNAWSPSDGRVVSYDHGCGAHSEATLDPDSRDVALTVVDTMTYEPLIVDDEVD